MHSSMRPPDTSAVMPLSFQYCLDVGAERGRAERELCSAPVRSGRLLVPASGRVLSLAVGANSSPDRSSPPGRSSSTRHPTGEGRWAPRPEVAAEGMGVSSATEGSLSSGASAGAGAVATTSAVTGTTAWPVGPVSVTVPERRPVVAVSTDT